MTDDPRNHATPEQAQEQRTSRRGFFREALAGLLAPVVEMLRDRWAEESPEETGGLDPGPSGPWPSDAGEPSEGVLRPPGAAAGEEFERLCNACGDCARACPVDAIVLDPLPRIIPARMACVMCSDLACAAACKTSALQPVERAEVCMGLAVWDRARCLLSSGRLCSRCEEICPVSGAIRLRDGVVEIDGALCAGCGMCEYHCPARPRALVVRPL